MRKLFCVFLTFISCAGAALTGAQAQETGFTRLERELAYIIKLWPGDYDNQEQVSFDAAAKLKIQRPRLHALIYPLNISQLGEAVLYAEHRTDDAAQSLNHQAIYVLSADEAANAVRVKTYALKDGARFQIKGRNRSALSKITAEDAKYQKGCDMLIQRDGFGYMGRIEKITCKQGNGRFLDRQIRIAKDSYTVRERSVDKAGRAVSQTVGFKPMVMQRARWFACMIDVPKTIPNRANHTQHYITIHDQGGTFAFVHPDGRDMTLLMRNTWSYGMQRKTFFIGVLDGNANRQTLVYGWGMPGQDRIGVNPGWIRIQCDLDTPENQGLQRGLREES
ncbi:MAG: chromophore lyase CpcT/CpeT [Pseudomonadota bacterium]